MPDLFPSCGLVSSLYRLAPSDGYPAGWECERRLKVAVQRLVSTYGQAEVIRRVQEYAVPKEQEGKRSWIMLTVWAAKERQRGGTI